MMGRPAGSRVLKGFRFRGRFVWVALLLAVVVGAVGLAGAAASDFHGTITAGGSSVGVTLSNSGDTGYLTFTGSSGERVFVKASTGTLGGSGIYTVTLLNPSSTQIGSTGFIFGNSTKFIDTTTLSSAGTYTIKITPFGSTTGTTTITLSDVSADSSGSITPGGSAVPVALSSPGQNGTLTFSATSGDRVFVTASTGTLSASGTGNVIVNLLSPSGGNIGTTSVITSNLTHYIDTTTLSSTGTYSVQVDPQDDTTGTTTITLYSVAADNTGTTAIDAIPATVTLAVGQNALLPFRGASGQSLQFDRSGISISNAAYTILNPDGSTLVGSGVQGMSSATLTATLGSTGVYTLKVDPFQDATGSATVTLSIGGDAPANAASFTACGTMPVFRAQPGSGSTTYDFQVASDSGFSSVVSDSGALPATNTYSPPPGTLTDGQTYYWRSKIGSGSWSSGRSFSINQSHLGADASPMWSDGPLAVNEVNGNLLVSLPGPQYPTVAGAMGASISYNSLNTTDSGFGAGWLFDTGSATGAPAVLRDDNLLTGTSRLDAVEAVFGDGSSSCYMHIGQTNTYASGPGDGSLLTKDADGTWTYTSGDTIASFGVADGETGIAELKSVESAAAGAGNGKLTYTFSIADPSKVLSISDESSRTVTFTWHSLNPSGCAAAIVCITGPDGVSWQYIGDAGSGTSGRLATVYDGVRNTATVSYDGSGRVHVLQNADDLDPTHASSGYNSSHSLTVSYDGSGRVSSVANGPISDQTDSTSTWSFAYTPGSVSTTATRATHGGLSVGSVRTAAGYSTVEPPNQQGAGSPKLVKVFYDGHGNILERDDTLGNIIEFGYDDQDEQLWSEDGAGNPTDTSWDAVNNVPLTVTGPDPDGAGSAPRPVTAYRYDETKVGTSSASGPVLQGLQGEYFDNINLAGRPKLRETDSTVDFSWGTGGPTGLGASDNFSVRWVGTITLPAGGAYTFSVRSDEGARLVVGRLVQIDNWQDQTVTTVSSPGFTYLAGTYKIELDYYEHTGPAEVHLRWSCATCSPSISDQVVPSSALQPAWENQSSTVSPSGRTAFSHFADPTSGQPDYSLVTLADGTKLISSYTYDSHGRLTQKVMPKGNGSATIDSSGNLSGTPDSNYLTNYTYYAASDTASPPSTCGGGSAVNQGGQLETRSVAGLTAQSSVYNSAGRQIALTNGAGTTCYSYDAEGRLTSKKAPGDSTATTFSYDPAGLTLSRTNAAGTDSYSYDEAGRLKDSVDTFSAETSYAYDDNGNLLTRETATGALSSSTNYTTSYSYDAADEQTGMTDPAGRAYSFFYDNRGNLQATQYPNGTFSWNDINPDGQLTARYNRHDSTALSSPLPSSVPADSSSSPLVDYAYTYTADGQISQEVRTGGSLTTKTTGYSYDNLGRLSQVTLPSGTCRNYSYDLDSNRTQIQEASSGCGGSFTSTASYTYTPGTTPGLDELTSQTGPTRSFTYNSDGAMTGRGTDTLTWDGWGRNTGGTYSSTSLSYSYDPAGNIRSRTGASTTTRYLYGGMNSPVFETDTSGTITLSYIQGPDGDIAHYAGPPTTGSTVSYLYDDGHGNLAATADNSGSRANNYTYDPFGAPNDSVPNNTTTQRWLGRFDKQLDTTSNLIQMGARPYDPTLGRFITTDPVDGGSLNTYDYADQDSIDVYDLDGMRVLCSMCTPPPAPPGGHKKHGHAPPWDPPPAPGSGWECFPGDVQEFPDQTWICGEDGQWIIINKGEPPIRFVQLPTRHVHPQTPTVQQCRVQLLEWICVRP
jgi:RHS repeat-associated protein